MKNKFILIMPILIFLIGMVSGTYYVANPTSCLSNDQTNYPGQYCDPQDICGIISGNVQCYDTSLISPPVSSSTTTGAGGTDYTCIGTACSGGFITDCYAATNCLTALCDRNATCYNKHTQTTCNSGSWISSSCSATCTTNYFACDSNTTDANGCEINAGASCGGGTGTIVLNQCYSASAGNCTSASRLDCNNDDSDSNPATCNGADGCEILIGGACSVGGLIGTYGATCTGSSGTCVLSKKNFVTGNNTQYSTNASETFLWGKDYGVGNLVNLTSNNNNSFIIDNQTNVIANNSNFSIGNKITMSLGIILEAITSTWAKITGSLWVTGNLNATGTGTFQNITVLGDKLCNTVNCFTLGELNTTGSGGNASWNQSFADTLYYGISNPSNFINSTYNSTYAGYGTFNTTLNIQNLYNSTMTNYVGTINSTLNIQNLYNSTALMYANLANVTGAQAMTINSTLNIQNLYNVTASMIANLSISQSTNSGNASWNQSFANTLYYGISNPSNFINSTYNSTYASYGTFNTTANIQALLAGTNISQYAFNQTMSLLTMQNLYNSTALMYAQLANVTAAQAMTINSTLNIQNLFNVTASMIANLSISQSSSGNVSWNQSFANTLYYGISNPSGFFNASNYSSYNATYASYGTFNSTLNIQNLYNATALMYAQLANVTATLALTMNDTGNAQILINNTNIYLSSLGIGTSTPNSTLSVIGNVSVSGNLSANYFLGNGQYLTGIQTYNSSYANYATNVSTNWTAVTFTTYNSTWNQLAQISALSSNVSSVNTTLNIQNLYNATALMYAQLANVTGAQAMTINSTLNIQQLFNSTMTNYVGTINSTLNIQNLYNSTALMYANLANVTAAQAMTINSTLNIQNLFNVTASMIANLSISQSTNSGNASWNQSFANTLYYGISNPSNFINSTYNSTYAGYGTFNTTANIQALLAGTNISQYAFNQTMSLLTMQNLYNSTALMYAQLANVTAAQAMTINSTLNIQNLFNVTASMIANLSISQSVSSGNASWNQSFANTLYYGISNPSNFINSTYNSTYASYGTFNSTLNIQNLYNSTALMYAQLANVTAAQAMTINSTLNIQNLYNSTMTNYVGTINNTLNIQNLYNSTVIQLINLANNTYANQVLMNSTISMIANLTFLQNFTTAAVQALVNSSYVFRGSANQTSVSCSNITGNATDLCTITSSGSGPKNTTAEIGALYNSTVIQLINLANNTYANQVLMNSTISMIANLSISQSASGKNYWGSNGSNIYNLTALIGIGTSSPDSLLTIGNSANALNVSGELYVNSSGISIGDPSISNALSLKGATGGAIVEFGSQGDWPTDSYPLGTNLYFVLDKNGNTADTSIVLRDQGATRSEIGLISDDNFHIKSVSGTYSNETFLDRMIIYNGNSSQGISNNANNVNGTIDFFGNQTLGNSKAGELLRLYPSSTSSSQNWFISGNSNTTDGWGLEMGFDFGTATSYINSIKHGSTYVPILFSVQNFTIATGTGSVTNNLIVTSAGNVGIGTTNPAFLLQTGISTGGADVNLSGMLYINTSDQDVGIQTFNPRSDLDVWGNFSTNSSFFINGAGSVGIGTLAPSKTLDVRGQGNFSGVIWYNNNTRVNITITNSTINTQMLYNATALLFAQMVNSTAVHQMLLNNTNVGFLQVNATQIVVTGGGNVTVAGNISAGWETITGTCAAGGTFCNASCTTGKTIMGGGCWGGALNASYPFNRTTWYCSTNSSTVVTKTVYAICGRFS